MSFPTLVTPSTALVLVLPVASTSLQQTFNMVQLILVLVNAGGGR
uniref:Uncharacterized protein n=1 Tax=Peronospora matthiolae TaxID=2874970 RepID=A0AAV1TFQ8_9STRA